MSCPVLVILTKHARPIGRQGVTPSIYLKTLKARNHAIKVLEQMIMYPSKIEEVSAC